MARDPPRRRYLSSNRHPRQIPRQFLRREVHLTRRGPALTLGLDRKVDQREYALTVNPRGMDGGDPILPVPALELQRRELPLVAVGTDAD